MTEPRDNTPEPEPGTDRERTDGADSEIPSAWMQFSPLAWALLASTLLHVGGLYLADKLSNLSVDLSADVEWLQGADRLTGLGQNDSDRFAKIPQEPEPPSDEKDSKTDQKLAKALKGEYDPPKPPAPDDSSPSAKTSEAPSARTTPTSDEQNDERPADEEDRPQKKPRQPQPFADLDDHRALDRAGPNDLPDMRSFAPGNAQLSALVRVNRIRGQPYEDVVRYILRNVPDYRLLLGVPAFDPIRDMDWFFMTSPNPRYIQHTFLAVGHKLSTSRVRELLDRRYPDSPPWSTYENFPVRDLVPKNPHYRDPRKILLTRNGMALVAKERLLPDIVGPLARDSKLLYPGDDKRGRGDEKRDARETRGGATSRASLLDGLASIHEIARRDDTVVLLSARGMQNVRLPGAGRLPPTESVRMSISNPDRPTLDVDVNFESASEARKFKRQCPAIRSAIEGAVPGASFCGLSSLLDRIQCRVEGTYVNVHGSLPADQLGRLASCASFAIPHPPALDQLPSPPRPAETDENDESPSTEDDPSGSEQPTAVPPQDPDASR